MKRSMYTKPERLIIYKKALRLLKNGQQHYICVALDVVTECKPDTAYHEDVLEATFPEVYAMKPEPTATLNYWFYADEANKRIDLMNTVIKNMKS